MKSVMSKKLTKVRGLISVISHFNIPKLLTSSEKAVKYVVRLPVQIKNVINETFKIEKIVSVFKDQCVNIVVGIVNGGLHHCCCSSRSYSQELQKVQISKFKKVVAHYNYYDRKDGAQRKVLRKRISFKNMFKPPGDYSDGMIGANTIVH